MSTVPPEVLAADLGYEYMRARWMAEDETKPLRKRQVAKAMLAVIEHAARMHREVKHGPADSRGDRGGGRGGRAGGRGSLAGE